MQFQPTVGVAIPSIKSRQDYLTRALQTVLDQTYPVSQISVAIDHDRHGAAPTRNRAAQSLTTDYIAFLDDDDELLPQHIELLVKKALSTEADMVYPWFHITGNPDPLAVPDENGRFISPFGRAFSSQMRDYLINRANFIPVTFLIKRQVFAELGGFPTPNTPEWPHTECEDWGFLTKLARGSYTIAHLPERTWTWHHHGKNTSGRGDRF